MSWHVADAMLERYAAGTLDDAWAFSLEAHMLTCAECRALLSPRADLARVETVWASVQGRVDAPRRMPVERALVLLGVRDHVARLVAATPSLGASWLLAVAFSLGFAALAAQQSARGLVVFLVLAALLPLAGVAASYGPGIDPTYEIGVVAPMSSFQLILVRAVAVLGSTAVLAALAALTLPHVGWMAAAWLVPSLALTVVSLALATFVPPVLASGSVALLWASIVTVTARIADDGLVAFRPGVQIGFVIIAAASMLVLALRRDSFDRGIHA